MPTFTWEGRFTPEDKARSDYATVPFDLATPARQLTVRYRYADASASPGGDAPPTQSIVDIGLFDPRGMEFPGGRGFRGWSGSARREFTVAEDWATPGYLPGPLPAGRYHVILGLYQLHPQGVDVQVTVAIEPLSPARASGPDLSQNAGTEALAGPSRSASGSRPGPGWLRGDLHSHTWHSDAPGSPQTLVAEARALGLDFLAVTDHNTVSHHRELAQLTTPELILIPGQEVTTYYGHMNVWGTSRWCDFRCRTPEEMAQVIELAHRSGGVCSLNHPKPGGPPWEYGFDLPVDAMEVWHTPWPFHNPTISALWDRLLSQGRRVPGVGGSDYHCQLPSYTGIRFLARPTTWVWAEEASVAGILAAILQGHACMSAGPSGPRLELWAEATGQRAMMGDTIHVASGEPVQWTVNVLGGAGLELRLVVDGETRCRHPVTRDEEVVHPRLEAARYVRAELVGDMPAEKLPAGAPSNLDLREWRWALSNPIYLEGGLRG